MEDADGLAEAERIAQVGCCRVQGGQSDQFISSLVAGDANVAWDPGEADFGPGTFEALDGAECGGAGWVCRALGLDGTDGGFAVRQNEDVAEVVIPANTKMFSDIYKIVLKIMKR